MSIQIIQRPASKSSPCLFTVYADPSVGPKLRDAMPKGAGVALCTETRPALSRKAIAKAFGLASVERLVATGFSAGCHGLREMLPSLELGAADVLMPADGTHVREEPHSTMPRQPWQDVVDRARTGAGPLVVVTHTYLTYTDTMRDNPSTPAVERAYLSTASTMRLLTGWPLEEPATGQRAVHSEGRLHVVSFESGEYDQGAHGRQLREALPDALRTYAAPWVDDTTSAPSMVDLLLGPFVGALWRLAGSATFPLSAVSSAAERALVVARGELEAAPREIPGSAHNPRIVSYGEHCRRGGRLLGVDERGQPIWDGGARVGAATDEEHWCAKLVSHCYRVGLRAGEQPVHGLRVSVSELIADLRASGRFRDVSSGYKPKPGDIGMTGREGGDPRKGGPGHVFRVETVGASSAVCIGGNENNTILRTARSLTDPALVGWGEV